MNADLTIQNQLIAMQDENNRLFVSKLIPTMNPKKILGIRTPVLRKYAKELYQKDLKTAEKFLNQLPHQYFDENNLHAFLIENIQDFESAIQKTILFLPYIDNWATCDSFSPKIFKKYPQPVYQHILHWLQSDHAYTIRFASGLLLSNYLDEYFHPKHPALLADIRSKEYYVQMMIAWYFSTALTKQYETVLPYLLDGRLEPWIHNKTIQKAIESRRISDEQKNFLKGLKIKIPKDFDTNSY